MPLISNRVVFSIHNIQFVTLYDTQLLFYKIQVPTYKRNTYLSITYKFTISFSMYYLIWILNVIRKSHVDEVEHIKGKMNYNFWIFRRHNLNRLNQRKRNIFLVVHGKTSEMAVLHRSINLGKIIAKLLYSGWFQSKSKRKVCILYFNQKLFLERVSSKLFLLLKVDFDLIIKSKTYSISS